MISIYWRLLGKHIDVASAVLVFKVTCGLANHYETQSSSLGGTLVVFSYVEEADKQPDVSAQYAQYTACGPMWHFRTRRTELFTNHKHHRSIISMSTSLIYSALSIYLPHIPREHQEPSKPAPTPSPPPPTCSQTLFPYAPCHPSS